MPFAEFAVLYARAFVSRPGIIEGVNISAAIVRAVTPFFLNHWPWERGWSRTDGKASKPDVRRHELAAQLGFAPFGWDGIGLD